MTDYDWPGNIRELRNAMEYAFVLCRKGLIQPQHLAPRIRQARASSPRVACSPVPMVQCTPDPETPCTPDPPPIPRDHEELLKALRDAGGNQSRAAKILGVSRVTVWKRMKKYGVGTKGVS
jgi:transcriptional regulator of acetoin/glycerol metabolism